jgi:hypothetical protein
MPILIIDGFYFTLTYNRLTEYSDFNIIVPTLFNFYHGLELLIKGMIYTFNENFETIHYLDKLFNKLKKLDQSGNEYINIIGKYVEKPIKVRFLNDFMQTEQINNIYDLYMAFRYPADTKFIKFYEYLAIHYKGSDIVSEVKEISMDIDRILAGAVKVYREVCDKL